MPELPEVEITVHDLNKEVLGRTLVDVWTDFKKMIKNESWEGFKKEIKDKKIQKIWRRGKYIIFDLSSKLSLLIHQKLTGHLLLGKWKLEKRKWEAKIPGPLAEDPMNRHLHLMLWLDDGRMLALSDLRKFAKVEILTKDNLNKELSALGPEPLGKTFTFQKFKDCFQNKRGKIKQILMDQRVIAGIGNIYSDEILWQAKIHPFKDISKLSEEELKKIYQATREILPKAIQLGGESISDFRRLSGKRGQFDKLRKVYRREGEKCSRCQSIIKRKKLAGRSAHFCPNCQRL